MRIAHLADLHFGRIAHAGIVEALVRDVHEQGVDLVVVSGDLTQRARPREYRQAAAFLGALGAPSLVVPGNHDVYPWWHPVHRLCRPRGRFDRWITAERYPTFEKPGVAVLGMDSATGRTIKRGRLGKSVCRRMAEYFAGKEESTLKVVAVHHPLAAVDADGAGEVARGGRAVLRAAAAAGVQVVLSGHWHISYVEAVEVAGRQMVLAQAGSAASNRWRWPQEGANTYQAVQVVSGELMIEDRGYVFPEKRFGSFRKRTFALEWGKSGGPAFLVGPSAGAAR